MTVTVLDTPVCDLGEGPVWDPSRRRLSWVDIDAGRLHVRAADGTVRTVLVPGSRLSAAFALADRDDAWVLVLDQGFGLLVGDGPATRLVQPEYGQAARVRMNDAAVDPQGRIWAGSMATDGGRGLASLYRFDVDGSITRMRSGLNAANGLGWSPEGDRFYLVDSDPGVLWIHAVDSDTGGLGPVIACCADLGPGIPDGLAVDADGCVWIAFYGAARLGRFDPAGRPMTQILLPASHPTSVSFGDDDLCRLYVTTARVGRGGQADGRLLTLEPGVRGLPTADFGGQAVAGRAPLSAVPDQNASSR